MKYVRGSVSPGALIAEFRRFLATDVRSVLPLVHLPTLIIVDPNGDGDTDPRNGRFAAAHISGASVVEAEDPGGLNWLHWYGRADGILREIGGFVGDLMEEEARFDRVLATVIGGRARRPEMARALAATSRVCGMLARYRGQEVDTAGDGFLATFDGPARAI
jgi:hypothetical protein